MGSDRITFRLCAHRVVVGAMRTTIKPTLVPIIWQRCDSLQEERFSCDTIGALVEPDQMQERLCWGGAPAFALATTHDEQEHGLVVGPHSKTPHNDCYIRALNHTEIAIVVIRIWGDSSESAGRLRLHHC